VKIALIVLGVIIFILLILLFLPLSVDLKYENNLLLKIKYSGITLFNSEKNFGIKKSHKKKQKTENDAPKKENFLKKTYKQKGLLGTIGYFSEVFILIFNKICWVVKTFKFRKFTLNINVATSNAAETAISYGRICSSVYPVISFLETNTDFKAKEININADFDKNDSYFKLSTMIKTKLFFWLIAAVCLLFNFLKLQRKEREKYERKQS